MVKKQTYEIVRNRSKLYKTIQNYIENRSNSDIFRRICIVNFYGFPMGKRIRFRTVSYIFVQFPTFTDLTGKICYVHKKFTNPNKMYESI